VTPARATNVLVVEDEWVISSLIAAALQDAGYAVVGPVGHLDDALQLLADEWPDVALLDVNLNGRPSFAIADHLRALNIPFAFMSGYAASDLPPNYRQIPLLQKPVDTGTICHCLNALLK
jgi:DNA-binding response OmpR family regulator